MPKTSILRNKQAVAEAIENSSSIKEALDFLNLRAAGGNYKAFNKYCREHGLIVPQWDRGSQVRALHAGRRLPNDEVFVINSTYNNRTNIKKRMYALGIPEQCAECGLGSVWNSRPITLTLEHKNGTWNDNRLENLEILCPNCHSQTSTYCGGNKRRESQ